MSIIEERFAALTPTQIRTGGYGLTVAAVVAGGAEFFAPWAIVVAIQILATLGVMAAALKAPELFEVKGRRGRGFNGVVFFPAALTAANTLPIAFVSLGPMLITALIGAGVAGWLASMRMGRGLVSPIQFVGFLVLMGAGLGYGAPALIDVRFDPSPGQAYHATVSSMYVTQGRGTSYNLRLGPWGPKPDGTDVRVSADLYNQLNPHDQVCIALHNGLIAIPWFELKLCPGPS
jgi:hypothetical protein